MLPPGSVFPSFRAFDHGGEKESIDAAIGYRFTSNTQLKLQYSFQHETTGPHDDNHLLAAQFTVRF